jgi:hypothetical protein
MAIDRAMSCSRTELCNGDATRRRDRDAADARGERVIVLIAGALLPGGRARDAYRRGRFERSDEVMGE